MEEINCSGDKVILTSSEGREFTADKVFVANNIIFIFYSEKNIPRISDKPVVVLTCCNLREQNNLPPSPGPRPPPFHSKLRCLLFPTGNSNGDTTLETARFEDENDNVYGILLIWPGPRGHSPGSATVCPVLI